MQTVMNPSESATLSAPKHDKDLNIAEENTWFYRVRLLRASKIQQTVSLADDTNITW